MAAVAYLMATWRSRWRALAVLALMVSLTGGATMAAVAGARRSATSLDRFNDAAGASDVFVAGALFGPEPQAFLDLLEGPLVASHNDLVFLFVDDRLGLFFGLTSRRGLDVERGVLVDGRFADPDEPDELVVSEITARRQHLAVGDVVDLPSITQEQADELLQGRPPDRPEGPTVHLHIVGIMRNGLDVGLGSNDTSTIATLTTPAFLETYGGRIGVGAPSHMVRLAAVPQAVDRFTDAVAAGYGPEHLPSVNVTDGGKTLDDGIGIVTAALLIAAIVIGLAGAAWVGAAVARHERLTIADVEVLRGLGVMTAGRRAVLMGTVAPGVAVGVVAAPFVAFLASPLFPVGVARRVDPNEGWHADLLVLAAGTAACAVLALAIIAGLATLLTRGARRPDSSDRRVPRAVDWASRSLRPVSSTGVRFALHAPRRSTAPVRAALLGATVGVVGLVAVAVVGVSLQHLVDTPAGWGTTWDVAVSGDGTDAPIGFSDADRQALLGEPAVEAASVLLFDEQVTIEGVEAVTMTLDPIKGEIDPTIVDGRAPRADDEIAVGRDTLHAAHAHIGDTVTVASRSQLSADYTIVGIFAYPVLVDPSSLAAGAALTANGGQRLRLGDTTETEDAGSLAAVIRWRDGADPDGVLARLGYADRETISPQRPPELNGLHDVEGFPLALAAALASLGSIATTHALIVTVRRRRRELGVLSSFGFAPSQRRDVIAIQATTIALLALAIGVPLGIVVGRVAWWAIARPLGVAPIPAVPVLVIAVGAIALVVALNVVALVPARSARRLRVAEALRAE